MKSEFFLRKPSFKQTNRVPIHSACKYAPIPVALHLAFQATESINLEEPMTISHRNKQSRHQRVSATWARGLAAMAASVAFSTTASATTLDLTTTEGFEKTCLDSPISANQLKSNDERVAFVICRDTTLAKQVIRWGMDMVKQLGKNDDPSNIVTEVTREIDYIREELGVSRGVLEKTRLGNKKSLRLVPSTWQMDLSGDYKTESWEKHFFAIPKRGHQPFRFNAPSNDDDYYQSEYNLDAAVRVDQSDVLWSLAYHQFIEGLLTNVRAYELDWNAKAIVLARPQLLKSAHRLIGDGFRTSEKMRRSVLAETTDDEEWIGNPQQKSSVFPIPLDKDDFATWGEVLGELDALWQGKHLVATGDRRRGGLLGEMAPLCPEQSGLNIASIYLKPPKTGTQYTLEKLRDSSATHCQKIDKQHPVSKLDTLIDRAQKSDMRFLRYLYWTN